VKDYNLGHKFDKRITQKVFVNHEIWFRIVLDENKRILGLKIKQMIRMSKTTFMEEDK